MAERRVRVVAAHGERCRRPDLEPQVLDGGDARVADLPLVVAGVGPGRLLTAGPWIATVVMAAVTVYSLAALAVGR